MIVILTLYSHGPLLSSTRHSITLNGSVCEQKGELAEQYRAIHLRRNEAYRQFIVGEDIAILTVEITQARVCDVHDSVRFGPLPKIYPPTQPLLAVALTLIRACAMSMTVRFGPLPKLRPPTCRYTILP